MRYFYDTEFIEDGRTIDLISIGIIADDGREFYAISSEFSESRLHADSWLMKSVWPSLPTVKKHCRCRFGHLDRDHPQVRTRRQIARAVSDFLFDGLTGPEDSIELWADYAAYDHVALCQLWGRMIDLPSGLPMWTNDFRQHLEMLEMMYGGLPPLPEQKDGLHNALEDARHLATSFRFAVNSGRG